MTPKKPHVVYWNNQPTPYVVDRFNAVADRASITFEAWFDNFREADRSWDVDPSHWRFPFTILGTNDTDPVRKRIPIANLRTSRPDLVVCNYDRLHMVAGAAISRIYSRRVALRVLPSYPAWSGRSLSREFAKQLIFRLVDGAKVPGPDGAAYAISYGMRKDRIWPVTQSITEGDYEQAASMTDTERLRRKADAGLGPGCTFVYVGRIWKGKGLDVLLDAFLPLSRRGDVNLLIVGDGDDEAYFKERTSGIPSIHWLGFIQPQQLPFIYAMSDVLVFPTLGDPNGLVVEEAMASGTPVIASSAAGDIRLRIRDGELGFVVPSGDAAALQRRMLQMLLDPARRAEMATAARRSASEYTSARYAAEFENFALGILNCPARTPFNWFRRD